MRNLAGRELKLLNFSDIFCHLAERRTKQERWKYNITAKLIKIMWLEHFLHILSKTETKNTHLFLTIYLHIVTGKAAPFSYSNCPIRHTKISLNEDILFAADMYLLIRFNLTLWRLTTYIYIYIYMFVSCRTANFQTRHFKYLLNKYTY